MIPSSKHIIISRFVEKKMLKRLVQSNEGQHFSGHPVRNCEKILRSDPGELPKVLKQIGNKKINVKV